MNLVSDQSSSSVLRDLPQGYRTPARIAEAATEIRRLRSRGYRGRKHDRASARHCLSPAFSVRQFVKRLAAPTPPESHFAPHDGVHYLTLCRKLGGTEQDPVLG